MASFKCSEWAAIQMKITSKSYVLLLLNLPERKTRMMDYRNNTFPSFPRIIWKLSNQNNQRHNLTKMK